jgi:pyrroline-5-carboxylate reductase
MTTIAVLGAGKIGEALLSGLLQGGRKADDLLFTEKHPERAAALTERYGVGGFDVPGAAQRADVLVVAVKPQDIEPLLDELAPVLKPGTLVVSLCAGLPTSLYERRLPDSTPVVRVMPNTPMVVGEAMSAISAGRYATDEHLNLVEELLTTVGKVARVPENQQDAVTALSGSGPAYFFYLVEAMIDAGILLGVPAPPSGRGPADHPVGGRRGHHAERGRPAPGHPARGRHVARGHHHHGHPRAGEARRARGHAGGHRSGPRPLGGAGTGPRGGLIPPLAVAPVPPVPLPSGEHVRVEPLVGKPTARRVSKDAVIHACGGEVARSSQIHDGRRGRADDARVEDDGVPPGPLR